MKKHHHILMLSVAGALLATTACGNKTDNAKAPGAQSSEAQKAAGSKTISAGMAADSKFLAAAKAAGLDQTLAGPGPYTVFVPADSAFGEVDTSPGNRAQLTATLTNLILPGTVLAADIGKAIDNTKGKAVLATMGGGTINATKEGDSIILTDSEGHKATVTQADDQFTNGVVHHISGMLMPGAPSKGPAVGDKAG